MIELVRDSVRLDAVDELERLGLSTDRAKAVVEVIAEAVADGIDQASQALPVEYERTFEFEIDQAIGRFVVACRGIS